MLPQALLRFCFRGQAWAEARHLGIFRFNHVAFFSFLFTPSPTLERRGGSSTKISYVLLQHMKLLLNLFTFHGCAESFFACARSLYQKGVIVWLFRITANPYVHHTASACCACGYDN